MGIEGETGVESAAFHLLTTYKARLHTS